MTKILVAYYSQSGHTASLAQQIADTAGADLHEITVADDVYPADMYATDDVYKQQVADGSFPALTSPRPNLSQYDLVLIGGPVWDQTLAGPVISFLQQLAGFSGKVADFSSAFSSTGNYEHDFQQLAHDNGLTPVTNGLHINGQRADDQQLNTWLQQLGEEETK